MNDRRTLPAATGLRSIPRPPGRKVPMPTPIRAVSQTAEQLAEPHETTDEAALGAKQNQRGNTRNVDTPLRGTSFTLPVDLLARLREAAADRDATLVAMILEAVEKNNGQLAELIEAERPASVRTSRLFPDSVGHTARTTGGPRSVVSIRISKGNLDVLDSLVEQHKADSRSQLISTALRAALT